VVNLRQKKCPVVNVRRNNSLRGKVKVEQMSGGTFEGEQMSCCKC